MKPQFKLVKPNDLNKVLTMMRDFNAIDSYPFDESVAKENILELINSEHLGRLYVIMEADEIIGYTALTFGFSFEHQGRDAFIDELYLKKDYRSKGIGGKTMEFIQQQAKELGVKAIHLEVEPLNEKGNNLYKKSGYISNGRTLMTKKLIEKK